MTCMKSLSTLFLFIFVLFFTKNTTAKTDKYRCIWNADPATMMTVGWNQVSGTNPVIYYDTQDYGENWETYNYAQIPNHNIVSKGMDNHFARLTSLIPSTTYYFVIKDSEGVSQRFSFTTGPDNPMERISIIAGGDSRNNRPSRRNANLLVSKLRPNCVMFAGDMTASDNATQWPQWFDDWQLTIPSDGRITPIITARGNHEYSNETLINLFDAPNKNVYFAFTIGGNLLRVYTLNSMMAAGGDQAAWLESDLSSNTDVIWKFAHYHHPILPHTRRKRDKTKQRTEWAPLFHEYGVDMVVECDAHTVKTTWPISPSNEPGSDDGFIRDDVNGTVYIGEGCWGAPLRPNDDDKAWTRNSGKFNQFKWIFVDRYTVEARTIKTDNADMVASVDPKNRFLEPANLDLWQPSNGGVIYLENDETLASTYPLAPAPIPVKEPAPKKEIPPVIPPKIPPLKKEPTPERIPSDPNPVPPPTKKPEPKFEPEPDYTPPKETIPAPPPKPVIVNQLESFNTRVDNDIVYFMLSAKNETDPMFFGLERSTNNIYFKEIDMKTSADPSKEEKNYTFIDENALFLNSTKVYYRIKYGSNNTETRYSAVRAVQLTPWSDYYELELNPESNLLRIHYNLQDIGNVDLHIYNSRGKEEIEQNFVKQKPGDYTRLVDLRGLASGTYLLQLRSGPESVIRRIVIP